MRPPHESAAAYQLTIDGIHRSSRVQRSMSIVLLRTHSCTPLRSVEG
jgi:hypothetical protein